MFVVINEQIELFWTVGVNEETSDEFLILPELYLQRLWYREATRKEELIIKFVNSRDLASVTSRLSERELRVLNNI